MLRHRNAGGGRDEGDGGRDVKSVQAIAAGAADVEDIARAHRRIQHRRDGPVPKLPGKGRDFLGGLALGSQRREELGFGPGWDFLVDQCAHRASHLPVGERMARTELFKEIPEHARDCRGAAHRGKGGKVTR
jgi:hypothetical protein